MVFALLQISLAGPCLSTYVLGTPGVDWSIEELVVVKFKLYSLFRYGMKGPKALRFGFHNVGTRRPDPDWVQFNREDNVNITDNNGNLY